MLDAADDALMAKLKAAKTLSRDALKEIIFSVHGGEGKDKLTAEEVRPRLATAPVAVVPGRRCGVPQDVGSGIAAYTHPAYRLSKHRRLTR